MSSERDDGFVGDAEIAAGLKVEVAPEGGSPGAELSEEVVIVDEAGGGAPDVDPDPEDAALPEELRGLSKAELARRLAEARAGGDLGARFEAGLGKLGEILTAKTGAGGEPPPPPPVFKLSAEDRAMVKEKLYSSEDPAAVLEEVGEKLWGKKLEFQTQALAQATAARFAEHEKRILLDHSEEFKTWQAEVEKEFAGLPPQTRYSGAGWEEALTRVKMRHLDEIVAARVAAAAGAEAGAGSPASPAAPRLKAPGGPAPKTQPGVGGSPAPRVWITQAQLDAEKSKAASLGLTWGSYYEAVVKPKYSRKPAGDAGRR